MTEIKSVYIQFELLLWLYKLALLYVLPNNYNCLEVT